jgi:hypothetical protein
MRIKLGISLSVLLLSATLAQAPAKKPNVPLGAPSRGLAVALVSDGIDYTRPTIAARLARDGEGELIGWDAVDGDRKPYAAAGPATRLVELSPALVAPIRVALADAASWLAALAFLARSPARVAVVAVPVTEPMLRTAAWPQMVALRDVLFIVPAGDQDLDLDRTEPALALPPKADNILVVSALPAASALAQPNRGGRMIDVVLVPVAAAREAPGTAAGMPSTSLDAAVMAVGLLTCLDVRAAKSPAEVKRTILAKASKALAGAPPMIEACR